MVFEKVNSLKKKKKVKLESKTVDLNDLLIHTTHFFSLFFKQIN